MTTTPTREDSHFKLGEISGKIDLILLNQAAQRQADEARFCKIEARLDVAENDVASLKQSRSWLLGAGAALGSLGGILGGYLGFPK